MSRGPGIWQRRVLAQVERLEGDQFTSVPEMVRAYVGEPYRSESEAARRAVRTLARSGRICALWLQACPACGELQRGRPTPGKCCTGATPARTLFFGGPDVRLGSDPWAVASSPLPDYIRPPWRDPEYDELIMARLARAEQDITDVMSTWSQSIHIGQTDS